MTRLAVRIFLLLAVLAMGRSVARTFFQSDDSSDVLVVVVPDGRCSSDVSALDNAKGN